MTDSELHPDFLAFQTAIAAAVPRWAVVLGSGLGALIEELTDAVTVSFANVPGFVAPSVRGHSGEIVYGRWDGVPVLVFHGRVHCYEGHSWERVTEAVRFMHGAGVRHLILTNAAGGLHSDLNPGDIMVLARHQKWLGPKAWQTFAPSEPPKNRVRFLYDVSGIRRVQKYANDARHAVLVGTYAALTGPCYETPAEIRALELCGADAVGMSTAMEAEAAVSLGIEVVGLSCITNKAAGLSDQRLNHAEVQQVAGGGVVVARMANLIRRLIVEA